MKALRVMIAMAGALLPATPALSDQAATRPASKASAEQVARWVGEMDDASSAVRDQAQESLVKAGSPAVGPVAKAAKGDSLEVTVRSIAVLKALLKSEDPAARDAARSALEKLAADEKNRAGREAREVLEADRPAPEANVRNAAGIITIVGQAVINMPVGGAGNAMKMSVTNANGRKVTEVSENGRAIKITEDKGGIVVKVTEKAEGDKPPATKEYKAADAAELKKKHPEGHALYEKYGKQNAGNIVLNVGNAPPPLPRARAAGVLPRLGLRQTGDLIDEARAELRRAVEKLTAGGKDGLDAKALAELARQIQAAEAKLAEARKGLPR